MKRAIVGNRPPFSLIPSTASLVKDLNSIESLEKKGMSSEPPSFQESARCEVCKCSFNAFRRRHHCRRCGRTLCHEHSSNQMALPQFGIHSSVRVCFDCFNNSSRSENDDARAPSDGIEVATDTVPTLDNSADVNAKTEPTAEGHLDADVLECKCRMPLCICEASAPPVDTTQLQRQTDSTSMAQSSQRRKKTDPISRNAGSTSNNRLSSSFLHCGQVNNSDLDKTQMDYEVNGEGLREAIKNCDIAAVKKLLSEGADANYRDKQGMSLLHLAALFNHTDIAFALMEYGASLECKNAQGETPLDCAPAMLQYKMRKKIEGVK